MGVEKEVVATPRSIRQKKKKKKKRRKKKKFGVEVLASL
jgi:hypothetical protein